MTADDGPATFRPPGAVLFACGRNAIRSPMAAAIARRLFPTAMYVESAGVQKGDPDPFAVAVMEEIGIDLSRHRPKSFDDLEDDSFDIVVTMSPEAQHRALELTRTTACEVEYWPTLDPSYVEGSRDTRLQAFREVRDQLFRRISSRFGGEGGPQV